MGGSPYSSGSPYDTHQRKNALLLLLLQRTTLRYYSTLMDLLAIVFDSLALLLSLVVFHESFVPLDNLHSYYTKTSLDSLLTARQTHSTTDMFVSFLSALRRAGIHECVCFESFFLRTDCVLCAIQCVFIYKIQALLSTYSASLWIFEENAVNCVLYATKRQFQNKSQLGRICKLQVSRKNRI